MSNIITKRVSMYVRIKPAYQKDFDFQQIIVRLGYIKNPMEDRYRMLNYTDDLLHDIRIFVTEANGTPHNKEITIPPEEAIEYLNKVNSLNLQRMNHGVINREAEVERLSDSSSECIKYMHTVLELNRAFDTIKGFITHMSQILRYQTPYAPAWASTNENIAYVEAKAALNKLVSMALNKPPRELATVELASPICFASMKRKYSNFTHEVLVDEHLDSDVVESKAPDIVIVENLLKSLKETKELLATGRAIYPFETVTNFLDCLSNYRRSIESDKQLNGDIQFVLVEMLPMENALDKVKQEFPTIGFEAAMEAAVGILFSLAGENLETALKSYIKGHE